MTRFICFVKTVLAVFFIGGVTSSCSQQSMDFDQQSNSDLIKAPGTQFDLSHWSITLPLDEDNDGVADKIPVGEIATYMHPEFFYLDDQNRMVFASPNKASTSPTSTNVRSELHYMLRGEDTSIAQSSFANNFVLKSNSMLDQAPYVGGKMAATLQVNHVSTSAKYQNKPPAYSVVIGQIHAVKLDQKTAGFGWGNEPLKISYKKWPNHQTGSIFWAYERNLAVDNPLRTDIAYTVWGNDWDDSSDPGDNGLALDEEFSYSVNVYGDVMHLVFENAKQGRVEHKINLANNYDASGVVDQNDYPLGYQDEMLYFKAGSYNQCSIKDELESFRYPACGGTGDWLIDKANGDYSKVTFSKLVVGDAEPM